MLELSHAQFTKVMDVNVTGTFLAAQAFGRAVALGASQVIVSSLNLPDLMAQLVPLGFDASLAGSGVAAISVTDQLAAGWLEMAGKNLAKLQKKCSIKNWKN